MRLVERVKEEDIGRNVIVRMPLTGNDGQRIGIHTVSGRIESVGVDGFDILSSPRFNCGTYVDPLIRRFSYNSRSEVYLN